MPNSDAYYASHNAHPSRSTTTSRKHHAQRHWRPASSANSSGSDVALTADEGDDSDSDSNNEMGEEDGEHEMDTNTTGKHRFWATRSPYLLASPIGSEHSSTQRLDNIPALSSASNTEDRDNGESRLIVRRSRAGQQIQEMMGLNAAVAPYAARQLQTGMPGMMGREHQSRILFVSLLENYCRTYDDDPLRNRRLFFAICRTLYSMGIIGKEYVDEMSSLRATYSDAFRQLVDRAQESLDMYEQHDIETGIRSLMSSIGDDSDSAEFESSYTGDWSASRDRDIYASEQLVSDPDSNCSGFGRKSSGASDSSAFYATESSNGDCKTASELGARRSSTGGPTNGAAVPDVSQSQGNRDGTRSAGTATARSAFGEVPRLRRMSRSGPVASTFETMMMDARRSRYHDDFVQLRCLGKGGFGKVYEVRNKLDGRPYAVKHIRIKGEITAEKTLREIKMLANLDHPNIVRYYSSWIEVNHVRKRAPTRRHGACSTSPPPARALCGAAGSTAYGERRSTTPSDHLTAADMMGVAAGNIAGGMARGRYIADSSSSLASFTSSHYSTEEMQFEDAIANPFDSATGMSIGAVSPVASINGGILLGDDSFDNGEAYVMAEVSIGHTNESYDQRLEAEKNIIFELSTGANAKPQT
ncbi:hypothetical protein H4R20_005254, partial [Coemansia guatemalensis]